MLQPSGQCLSVWQLGVGSGYGLGRAEMVGLAEALLSRVGYKMIAPSAALKFVICLEPMLSWELKFLPSISFLTHLVV